MFTGIIEEAGVIVGFSPGADAWKLVVAAKAALRQVAVGDSIAVNGCCLTVTHFDAAHLHFDVLEQTRRVTSLASLGVGAAVNLERSLRFDGKIGGHFVTGHVDDVGVIAEFAPVGRDHVLRVRVPAGGERYLIAKGSIALDGISLTVADIQGDLLTVWLIPTTLALTNLREKAAGDLLNLEYDLLGKYVERLTSLRRA